MAQILIRGLTESELKRLKEHAKEQDRSLEAQARIAVREAAKRPTQEERADFINFAATMRRKTAGRVVGDSAEIIRHERDVRSAQVDRSVRSVSRKR